MVRVPTVCGRPARCVPLVGARPASGRWLAAAAALVAAGAAAPPANAVPTGPPVQIATGLKTPWELAVAPDGRTFVSERDGGIRTLDANGHLLPGNALERDAIPRASGVSVRKILGLALHPDFATNHLAYLYVSLDQDGDGSGPENGVSRIFRLRESGGTFTVERQVFDGIGSDDVHDGGRMVFGPDRRLYVTTGDIHQPSRPQDLQSLNGKILRFAAPGDEAELQPAPDNPFVAQGGNARYVWSYGHRHPQGLAFDAAGRLWETEHGPTGEQHGPGYPGGNGKTGRDELNVIVRGGDYGWPLVSGPDGLPGMIPPVAVAGDSPSWAPGDVAVGADGSIYAPFLAGSRLQRFDVHRGSVFGQSQDVTNLGRLRLAVAVGHDLLIAQDGTSAGIYRMPLSDPIPGGSDAADPGPPTPSDPSSPPFVPPVGSAPPPIVPPSRPPSAPADPTGSRVRLLVRRIGDRARRIGARRLAGGRAIAIRVGGLPAGRLRIELRLRTSRGRLLARTTIRVRSTATRTYRLRLSGPGRARLRAAGGGRVVVGLRHRPTDGRTASTTAGVRLPR